MMRQLIRRLVVAAFAILTSVTGATHAADAAAQTIPAPPGRLIDVGGHNLHLNCSGSGPPTVVLEAAFGGSSPLIVLSAGADKPLTEYRIERELRHDQLQMKLLALSPRSKLVRVPGSDHYVHLDRPDLVADALRELIDIARKSSKVTAATPQSP